MHQEVQYFLVEHWLILHISYKPERYECGLFLQFNYVYKNSYYTTAVVYVLLNYIS